MKFSLASVQARTSKMASGLALRYSVSKLIVVAGRAEKLWMPFVYGLAVFEFFNRDPRIKLTFRKKENDRDYN